MLFHNRYTYFLGQTASQINHRDIGYWNTEGHASELAIKVGDNFAYGLGSTSGSWDNVLRSVTTITPCLSTWSINGLLCGSVGMNSGHEAFNDAKLVIDYFSQWC